MPGPCKDLAKRERMEAAITDAGNLSRGAILERLAHQLGYKNAAAAHTMAHRWGLHRMLPGGRGITYRPRRTFVRSE